MMQSYGQAILEELKKFDSVHTDGNRHTFQTQDFNIELSIDPKRWLGIRLELKPRNNRSEKYPLFYELDTDLYKFDDPANHEFIKEIESSIVSILGALRTNKIIVGTRRNRPAFAIPEDGQYRYVYQTLFSAATHMLYPGIDQLLNKGRFTPNEGQDYFERSPCEVCGYLTVAAAEPHLFAICPVCFWEDDESHDDPDEPCEGANHNVSINTAKQNFKEFGAYREEAAPHVRKPYPIEMPKK